MITIKKVDMNFETAYQLNELGFAVIFKNGNIQLVKEN